MTKFTWIISLAKNISPWLLNSEIDSHESHSISMSPPKHCAFDDLPTALAEKHKINKSYANWSTRNQYITECNEMQKKMWRRFVKNGLQTVSLSKDPVRHCWFLILQNGILKKESYRTLI